MYFTTTPALMSLEGTMQQVPNFPPRGGGKYYSKKSYKSKYCHCRLCSYYKKTTGCTQEACPILNERLECGAATINDAVLAVFGKVKHHPLRKRIERIYMRKESEVMKFRNIMHQAIFEISKSKQHMLFAYSVTFL